MPYPNYTNCEAADIIENEGLGYAVQHYTSADTMKDPETQRRWKAASDALDALSGYLADQTGRDL